MEDPSVVITVEDCEKIFSLDISKVSLLRFTNLHFYFLSIHPSEPTSISPFIVVGRVQCRDENRKTTKRKLYLHIYSVILFKIFSLL